MKNIKVVNKLFAVLGFALVIFASISSFNYSGYTYSMNSYFILIFVVMILASLYLDKQKGISNEVAGSFIFYLFTMFVSGFFYLLNNIYDFILELREDALQNELNNLSATSVDKIAKITKQLNDLRETMSNDIFGKTIDIIGFILVVTFITFAAISIINILREKDFDKSFVGKKTSQILSLKENLEVSED